MPNKLFKHVRLYKNVQARGFWVTSLYLPVIFSDSWKVLPVLADVKGIQDDSVAPVPWDLRGANLSCVNRACPDHTDWCWNKPLSSFYHTVHILTQDFISLPTLSCWVVWKLPLCCTNEKHPISVVFVPWSGGRFRASPQESDLSHSFLALGERGCFSIGNIFITKYSFSRFPL